MQVVNIGLPFGQTIPGLFCPMCGAVVHDQDVEPSCSHILFTYHDISSDFMYVKKGYEQQIEKAEEIAETEGTFVVDELAKMIKSESSVCLAVTGSGMACGPVSYTYYVGFDLGEDEE